MKDIDAQMIAAHEAKDSAALIRLYTRAADQANDLTAACFYLTHAYVFALEAGAPEATTLHARLKAHGREE
ncbi:hypothetical protein [Roseovarius aestuarii]|uniref:HEPN domain-containing protein n=1 Tax=Roseovarius aestuarii TaxID=475083 RepID=A0A1X7BV94_9RHOB|nr:hypothetical protein [Roseovarius aestuarii]SMC13169.1 hypothetical protein ROA7745_03006 [Roseovarius aestuarii]